MALYDPSISCALHFRGINCSLHVYTRVRSFVHVYVCTFGDVHVSGVYVCAHTHSHSLFRQVEV